MKIIRPFVFVSLFLGICATGFAQTYHNRVNQRFNTTATGPMQATIVDVPDIKDQKTVLSRVASQLQQIHRTQPNGMAAQLALLQKESRFKYPLTIGVPDIVLLRQGGKLVFPQNVTRAAGPNDITFVFPAQGANGAWPLATQQNLQSLINAIYPQLKQVYGNPSWSGTITVMDGDKMTPAVSDRDALSGGVYNASSNQIIFAEYNTLQTAALSMTEMMAIAFHGPDMIAYDAWEKGMARAATVITVNNMVNAGLLQNVSAADPLWQAMNIYDLLNQPALGNDRFIPVSLEQTPFSSNTDFGGMLYPRLQMSGTAWLKVAAQDPSFFRNFNSAYYSAVAATPSLSSSVPNLKQLAQQVLNADGASSIEGSNFSDWYQSQYILDTSISPGPKEYAWCVPSRPATGSDDYSFSVVLVYQNTTIDSNNNSNEVPLAGTCYPIYWDYTYTNRLYLSSSSEQVTVMNGQGTDAPTFLNNIGGNDPNGHMRIAMDFPINQNNTRLYVAPRSMGTLATPNNFWGVVVGADDGSVTIQTETGVNITVPVVQGSFGTVLDASAFSKLGRTTLTYTSSTGQTTVRQVVTGFGEFIPVIYVNNPISSRIFQFPAGPSMISFPIQPLAPNAADALLDPTSGQPIFNSGNLLMAQWQQNAASSNKYLQYPTMAPLQPGQGYWENFSQSVNVKINGRLTSSDPEYSVGLIYGWNQIGNPYETAIQTTDLTFQHQANNIPTSLADAITNGWIGQNVTGLGNVAFFDYSPTQGYIPATTLQPWKGYWARVLVTEGLTITYTNPSRSVRSTPITRAVSSPTPQGWSLPLLLSGPDNHGWTLWLGQSSQAKQGYDPALDIPSPPLFTRAVSSMAFNHTDWDTNSGDYLTEFHQPNSQDSWEVTVNTPTPQRTYMLTWQNIQNVPRTTRLIMQDVATGKRFYLNGTSSYSFNSGTATTRMFKITPEIRTANPLRIINVFSSTSRAANSMEISFDLTQSATVSATILDASGKVVRQLQQGRAASLGTSTLLWDIRNDRAISVPAGAYILQIKAVTPDGDSAKVIQPLMVIR
jgi:hypothetical protein